MSASEKQPRVTRASDELSKTVLYFDGHRKFGFAESGGTRVDFDELTELPEDLPLPKNTTNVSFYHEQHNYWLKEDKEPVRPMNAPEVEAIHQFLASIARFGKRLKKSWRKAL